ncbi:MAG: response regulator [bacterium]|nr:response regulator [bacterium]
MRQLYALFLFLCLPWALTAAPLMQEGLLDCSRCSKEQLKSIHLDGRWRFFPNQLITEPEEGVEPRWVQLPAVWTSEDFGIPFGPWGYGTYYLKLLLPPEAGPLALHLPIVRSSAKLYLNGNLYWEEGRVERSRETYQPDLAPHVVRFPEGENSVDLMLQVANFDYLRGGVAQSINLGHEDVLDAQRHRMLTLDLLVMSALWILGAYSLSLFAFHRYDRRTLYFGLTCLALSVRILGQGDILAQGWFVGQFELLSKIRNLPDCLAMVFFVLFTKQLFPLDLPRWVLRFLVASGLLGASASLLLSFRYYGWVEIFMEYAYLAAVAAGVFVGLRATRNQRQGAWGYLLSFAVFAPTIVNDVLYSQGVIHTAYIGSFGIVLFLFVQSIQINLNFSRAFQEVEILSTQLEASNQELLELDRLKDQFLANTSHELRTPLQGIIGIAESFPPAELARMTDLGRANLELISYSAKRLSNLVTDLLDITLIRDGQMRLHLAALDLRVLTDAIFKLVEVSHSRPEVKLQHQIPPDFPLVWADSNRIQQVLYNLIDNALKFTKEGQINVRATYDLNFARVEVQDTGVGIPAETLGKIFEPFTQVSTGDRAQFKGTGLGLSIARELTELQGGSIEIFSALGAGTTVVCYFPLAEETRETSGQVITLVERRKSRRGFYPFLEQESQPKLVKETSPTEAHRGRIMVVDDEVISLQAQLNLLQNQGFDVIALQDGFEALKELEKGLPALILVDLMMPRMSGLELCQRIRELWEPDELPIIVVTAKTQVQVKAEVFEAGANDYLSKPFDPVELVARVDNQIRLCNLKGLQKELEQLRSGSSEPFDGLLVRLMVRALNIWELTTGLGKVELAEQSGIWNVYLDGSTYKTRTLDRYLSTAKLPKRPRWRDVLATAEFVALQPNLSPGQREELSQLKAQIEKLVFNQVS